MGEWFSLAERVDALTKNVTIAVVGKYTNLSDAYLSISKALHHASFKVERKLMIEWIDSEHLEEANKRCSSYGVAWSALQHADGIMVPGGFGERGVEGKISAAKFARESGKPYLGVCLGFQLAVVEFARNVLGLMGAHSVEFDSEAKHKIVVYMPEVSRTHMGGTMRLGSRTTILGNSNCITSHLYEGVTAFEERHRHRYEVNGEYVSKLEEMGLHFVGRDVTNERMEVFELTGHVYYVGSQFHPEFKSRPNKPSPLFLGLLRAASGLPL